MNIFSSLLFLHGHIASAELARQLATPVASTTGAPAKSYRSTHLDRPAAAKVTCPTCPAPR
ncbi:hypothetical protein ACODUO_06730 [Stenotrophomonas maltophilia]